MGAGYAIFGALFGFFGLVAILSLVAFIWALIDILKAKNDPGWKILWVIVCFFLGVIGVILYYFIGRKNKK
jgi:hypothetical protein